MVEALSDPLLRPALEEFVKEMRADMLNDLMRAVRAGERHTHRESFLAGKVEVYESLLTLLDHYAKVELERSKQ